jgi:hypothetical protein
MLADSFCPEQASFCITQDDAHVKSITLRVDHGANRYTYTVL